MSKKRKKQRSVRKEHRIGLCISPKYTELDDEKIIDFIGDMFVWACIESEFDGLRKGLKPIERLVAHTRFANLFRNSIPLCLQKQEDTNDWAIGLKVLTSNPPRHLCVMHSETNRFEGENFVDDVEKGLAGIVISVVSDKYYDSLNEGGLWDDMRWNKLQTVKDTEIFNRFVTYLINQSLSRYLSLPEREKSEREKGEEFDFEHADGFTQVMGDMRWIHSQIRGGFLKADILSEQLIGK